MGEAKRLKTLDDIYGRSKLPESARPFIRAMQEMVELREAIVATKSNVRSGHQFFLDGELNGERGVYGLSIPTELFDFREYSFTASVHALTGFMGGTRFGIAMHSSGKKTASSVPNAERGNVIMMLACIDGMWFYNTMNTGEKEAVSMPKSGEWNNARIEDLTMSDQTNQFMTTIADILKKSHTMQDNAKAVMTLQFLKEHYRATVTAPMKKH